MHGKIQSIVGRMPNDAKRVVAYRYKDEPGYGIYVNSAGTHASDEFLEGIERISTFLP